MSRFQNFAAVAAKKQIALRAVFRNHTSRSFNYWLIRINSRPKILRSCFLHCLSVSLFLSVCLHLHITFSLPSLFSSLSRFSSCFLSFSVFFNTTLILSPLFLYSLSLSPPPPLWYFPVFNSLSPSFSFSLFGSLSFHLSPTLSFARSLARSLALFLTLFSSCSLALRSTFVFSLPPLQRTRTHVQAGTHTHTRNHTALVYANTHSNTILLGPLRINRDTTSQIISTRAPILEPWHPANISQAIFKHTVHQPQSWFIGPFYFVLHYHRSQIPPSHLGGSYTECNISCESPPQSLRTEPTLPYTGFYVFVLKSVRAPGAGFNFLEFWSPGGLPLSWCLAILVIVRSRFNRFAPPRGTNTIAGFNKFSFCLNTSQRNMWPFLTFFGFKTLNQLHHEYIVLIITCFKKCVANVLEIFAGPSLCI